LEKAVFGLATPQTVHDLVAVDVARSNDGGASLVLDAASRAGVDGVSVSVAFVSSTVDGTAAVAGVAVAGVLAGVAPPFLPFFGVELALRSASAVAASASALSLAFLASTAACSAAASSSAFFFSAAAVLSAVALSSAFFFSAPSASA
jgi:hypothetical protein